MLDFMKVSYRSTKNGFEVYPHFVVKTNHQDLMIRGGDFYAIWDDSTKLWSTDEGDAIRIIDNEITSFIKENEHFLDGRVKPLYMWDSDSGSIDKFHKYCQKQSRDSFTPLDENLVFLNSGTDKELYASKRLPYSLEEGSTNAWDRLIGTLYAPEERHKIEWSIGSIVSGESKTLQKFIVLYGSAGTGKSTILNIIEMLFDGYYSVFDAKALGSSSNSFALEAFKSNPLVAIQHDGDLSRIEDNTRLNSLVSHEFMTVNEKFKSTYANRFKCFLYMGTNKPVKITDSRSGLIRRLIDVVPSGNKIPGREYKDCMQNVKFELGAIAYKCLQIYLDDPDYYDDYIPTRMMESSNDFYNYMLDMYSKFITDDGVTAKIAWEAYKAYCEESAVPYKMSYRAFKEELKAYFKEYKERATLVDGTRVRNYYCGFKSEKFDTDEEKSKKKKAEEEKNTNSWLEFKEQSSIFDQEMKDCPAQYANTKETPTYKWSRCYSKLSEIDTSKLHYVKVPENHIVIDFDIKGDDGKKSFEKNLEAASKWPATYAEVSKGGEGIHLHYIYNGDVTKLSHIYDDNIEIKVFSGDSSLRRKLTKCVDIGISTISSGLPLKECNKVINKDIVQTEKGLRTTIKKCLLKEVHAGTKCNVDFIYKILEDAYTSGMKYDVSDLQGQIVAFAANSTNNADYCLKLVNKMHFKSDEPSTNIDKSDTPIVFYDIEVFPNLFLVNWKIKGEKVVTRMINPTPEQIEDLLYFKLIGFNCRRYDNHLLYARLMGYTNEQLYRLSQKIIDGDRNAFFGEAYNLSYTDVYDFASAGNKKSLKKLEIEMSNKANDPTSKMDDDLRSLLKNIKHQELGLPWDKPVPEELWDKVAEYCDNDVYSTEAAFEYLSADWTARQILADLAGMTVNDTTNSLTTRIIFGKNRKPQNEFHYRNLSEPVFDLDEETRDFLEIACPKMVEQTHGEDGSLLPYFPGYKYEAGKSTYKGIDVGEGGYVYAEPGIYINAALLDISSMHPHSTIAECLFGVRFTKAYRDIVEGRVSIKHKSWSDLDDMLDGRLKPFIKKVINGEMTAKQLANALKTAINSVYGLTAAGFDNPFRDPRNIDNIVAKRGALFMIDLKEEVEKRGFKVAHIKTDSIKIPNATPEIIKFVMDFGERYGYTFEHEATYDRMCLVNDAVYIAKYKDPEECKSLYGYIPGDNEEHGGQWTATGKQFAVPYLFKTMFSHEDITFSDMCETFAVSKGDLYLDMNENLPDVTSEEKELEKFEQSFKKGKLSDTTMDSERKRLEPIIETGHDLKFVGRVGQFCPILPGKSGGVLYRIHEGKKYAAPGSSGFRWLESDMVKNIGEDIIDRRFYNKLIDDAVDTISKYGDYEWFVSDDPYIPEEPDFMKIPDGIEDPDGIPFV